ncbi:non-heme iron oxygenase ferredoxin subunit [Paralcaligenes ureilyticus]|uniref:Naphthalene 1,2-dioxygenase system ferredoxin subunit n=1 Tax=Paralcaligenes ureilyticus TaxID=627131 RepID=A0A4R3M9V2_9BURK|nr:non-heme iron oxygenase ferredoxin subunit [Paralcaligenes ureilyticus]TCT09423.1 naphthalene 1,2-dioxygenase system ferredoxin subunit [Paralcaligenes ureilyticus]
MVQRWVETGLLKNAIGEDEPASVIVEGHDVAIYRVGEEIFATSNICTHGQARLCEGYLEDYEIECPLHQGRFDVRSGKALCAPVTVDIRVYPVEVQDGSVRLGLAE